LSIIKVVSAVSAYSLFINIEKNGRPDVRIIKLKQFKAYV